MKARPGWVAPARCPTPLSGPAARPRCPPYLVTELVAGEAEDLEPAGAVALLQLVELQEVARGRASERRHIGHQQHLAPQRAQRHGLRRAQGPRRHPRQTRRTPDRCHRRHAAHCRRSDPAPAAAALCPPRPAGSRLRPRAGPAAPERCPAQASPPRPGPPAPPGLGGAMPGPALKGSRFDQ